MTLANFVPRNQLFLHHVVSFFRAPRDQLLSVGARSLLSFSSIAEIIGLFKTKPFQITEKIDIICSVLTRFL